MAHCFVGQKRSLKPHLVLPQIFSFGNSALFLSQNPQRQSAHYYYFCSSAFKKQTTPYVSLYLCTFLWFLKARMPYGANQTKTTEDLFKAGLPKVQAIIPNSITRLRSSICKPNGNSAVETKLTSPRLKLEVDSPPKHGWRVLVQRHRTQVTDYSQLAQEIPFCPQVFIPDITLHKGTLARTRCLQLNGGVVRC